MLTEKDITNMWRELFRVRPITTESLTKAEELVDKLNPSSPLRVRFGNELRDIRKMLAEVSRKRR